MANDSIDRRRLFLVGNLSIFMIGLGFAVRANIAPDLQREIYDKIDLANGSISLCPISPACRAFCCSYMSAC